MFGELNCDVDIIASLIKLDNQLLHNVERVSLNLDDYGSSSDEDEQEDDRGKISQLEEQTNEVEDDENRDTREPINCKNSILKKSQALPKTECTIFDNFFSVSRTLLLDSTTNVEKNQEEEGTCQVSLQGDVLTVNDSTATVSFSITKNLFQQWEAQLQQKKKEEIDEKEVDNQEKDKAVDINTDE